MALELEINSYPQVEEMIQDAVLADIVDLGIMDSKFGKKHKIRFVWILAEKDDQDRNKRAFETFTFSANEKARLRARLKEFGEKFESGTKIQLEKYVGIQRKLVLAYEDGSQPGKPFLKITASMKPTGVVEVPEGFVRAQDRKD